jgi:cyclase
MGSKRILAKISARAAVGGLLVVILALTVIAQQAQYIKPPGADYQGQAFTFNRIQDDVYHAVGTGKVAVGCNASIIINANDVMVVDSHISPAAAWALVEELKAITPKPVKFVVNTHFHFDHVHGNQIFPGDVEIIGHEFTRQMILAGNSKSGRSYEFFIGGLPTQIEKTKQQMAVATKADEKAKLQDQLTVQQNELDATNAVKPVAPTVTMTQSMTIYRGNREIRLLFLGRGHTGGDIVVFLPKERVLMTGDLLTAGISYIGDAYPLEWIDTLEKVKALDFDVVLPGHGQAFKGKDRFTYFQEYLKDFWVQAEKLHTAKVPWEQAAKQIDMRPHAAHFPDIKDVGVFPHGVARAYELMDGTGK